MTSGWAAPVLTCPWRLPAIAVQASSAHHAVHAGIWIRACGDVVQCFGKHSKKLLFRIDHCPRGQLLFELRDHQIDFQMRAHCSWSSSCRVEAKAENAAYGKPERPYTRPEYVIHVVFAPAAGRHLSAPSAVTEQGRRVTKLSLWRHFFTQPRDALTGKRPWTNAGWFQERR